MPPVTSLADPALAAHLLDPLRARILGFAREPLSASQIAEKVGMQRQRVNYHVRTLAKAGLLKEAGRRERRNLTEVLYVASAPRYLVDPAALSGLAPTPETSEDKASLAHVMALCARTQHEAQVAQGEAEGEGRAGGAITLDMEVRFASNAERDAFAKALQEAAASLAARFGSPRGRAHRVVAMAHPRPRDGQ